MTWQTIIILGSTLLMGFIFLCIFLWAVRDGQFENVEEAKYAMFRDDDGEGDDFD